MLRWAVSRRGKSSREVIYCDYVLAHFEELVDQDS